MDQEKLESELCQYKLIIPFSSWNRIVGYFRTIQREFTPDVEIKRLVGLEINYSIITVLSSEELVILKLIAPIGEITKI